MREYCRNPEISSEYLNIGRIFKYPPMVLAVLGGMGSYVGGLGVSVRLGRDCEGSAVMRGRAGNARLMGQMRYVIWFSF